MIDVHQLAGELGVSIAVVRQAVVEVGGTADAPVSPDVAGQVRDRLRNAQRKQGTSTGGTPMFSGPAAPTAPVRSDGRVAAPVFATNSPFGAGQPPRPPQRPQDRPAGPVPPVVTGPPAPVVARPPVDREQARTTALSSGIAAQTAESAELQQWRAAGLGAHDGHLIAQCQRHGITPDDLRRRVDGQSVASRLKNGESVSSVRSRMA